MTAELARLPGAERPTARQVLCAISAASGVPLQDLLRYRGPPSAWAPRKIAMLISLEHGRTHSLTLIGRYMGGKDRTTVRHNIACARRLLSQRKWRELHARTLARLGVA